MSYTLNSIVSRRVLLPSVGLHTRTQQIQSDIYTNLICTGSKENHPRCGWMIDSLHIKIIAIATDWNLTHFPSKHPSANVRVRTSQHSDLLMPSTFSNQALKWLHLQFSLTCEISRHHLHKSTAFAFSCVWKCGRVQEIEQKWNGTYQINEDATWRKTCTQPTEHTLRCRVLCGWEIPFFYCLPKTVQVVAKLSRECR